MIVPNCRQRITGEDLGFALQAVGGAGAPAAPGLERSDVEVDDLLDSHELLDALVGERSLLPVSPWLFYYVLVRQVFLAKGIGEREVADYVGALLAHFLEGERLRSDEAPAPRSFVYLVDLVESARRARDARAAFAMEARIGDVALFLTGVFPDAIYHRQTYGRRLPGLEYYESVGRSGYRSAAQHPPPRHAELARVLALMASRFSALRKALNDLSDTYFCMTRGGGDSVDRLLRQALYGTSPEPDALGGEGREDAF